MNFVQAIPCNVQRTRYGHHRGVGLGDLGDGRLALLDTGAPGWRSPTRRHQEVVVHLPELVADQPDATKGRPPPPTTTAPGKTRWTPGSRCTWARSTPPARSSNKVQNAHRCQVKADGSQPLEIVRTRSWHYANFNATALCRTAEIGKKVGMNLWAYTGAQRRHADQGDRLPDPDGGARPERLAVPGDRPVLAVQRRLSAARVGVQADDSAGGGGAAAGTGHTTGGHVADRA